MRAGQADRGDQAGFLQEWVARQRDLAHLGIVVAVVEQLGGDAFRFEAVDAGGGGVDLFGDVGQARVGRFPERLLQEAREFAEIGMVRGEVGNAEDGARGR